MESLAYWPLACTYENPEGDREAPPQENRPAVLAEGDSWQRAGTAIAALLAIAAIAVPGPALASSYLTVGDRGSTVTRVQDLLGAAGFSPGASDGQFGCQTVRAVREFQRSRGLFPKGSVDFATARELLAAVEERTGQPALPNPEAIYLSPGDTGPTVRRLQAQLRRLGAFNGGITGQFDRTTAGALQAYAGSEALLPKTSELVEWSSPLNQSDLTSACNGSAPVHPIPPGKPVPPVAGNPCPWPCRPVADPCAGPYPSQPATPVPVASLSPSPSGGAIAYGETSDRVRVLQGKLRSLGYFHARTNTGYYGPLTRQAVTRFQQARGLPPTGVADAATLETLAGTTTAGVSGSPYAHAVPTATGPVAVQPQMPRPWGWR